MEHIMRKGHFLVMVLALAVPLAINPAGQV
jgi:hypothetical protein